MPDQFIVEHCSPTLAGLKTGNLFSVRIKGKENSYKEIRELNKILTIYGLRAIPVRCDDEFTLIYVYRPDYLSRDLSDPEAVEILERMGYMRRDSSVDAGNARAANGDPVESAQKHKAANEDPAEPAQKHKAANEDSVEAGQKHNAASASAPIYTSAGGHRAERFLVKLVKRMQESGEFPHEIGLFLGYPPVDVKGFMENPRQGVKCVGFWKVYGDQEKAERTFSSYRKCTETYRREIRSGKSLEQLIVRSA